MKDHAYIVLNLKQTECFKSIESIVNCSIQKYIVLFVKNINFCKRCTNMYLEIYIPTIFTVSYELLLIANLVPVEANHHPFF